MAAPSGITWGSVAGDYGKIGIYTSTTNTNTKVNLHVEVWFASKYSVSDSSNTYYYDNRSSSGSATTNRGSKNVKTTVSSGDGWSTSNQIKLAEYDYEYTKGTTASTRYLYAKLTNIDRVGSAMTASKTVSIPKLASYTITYNANGGTGAPSDQTKYYGKSLTLSATKPTRSGYVFQGWGTSSTDTSANYAAGASYTSNAALTLYAIWKKTIKLTYNVNGGSGSISSQSASVYNATTSYEFTVSSTKPTKTGHTFLGWSTSKSSTTATYSAGGSITLSSSTTIYAVWKANTYKITYNANGGTGAPNSQTKTYGTALTLSSTKPTRKNYNFLGWSTSKSSTTATYSAGGKYTANSAATLYAVWSLAYVAPRIFNVSIVRCTYDETTSKYVESDDGESVKMSFDWICDVANPTCTVAWETSGVSESNTITLYGTSGTASDVSENYYDVEKSYSFTITINDGTGSNSVTTILNSVSYPIDILAKGKGIAFGKTAELENTADFGYDARFTKPVYGKALGMDRITTIPSNSDFNDYLDPGCYAVHSNNSDSTGSNASTMLNIPIKRSGRLEVWSSTGEGIRNEEYSYIRQRFVPYNAPNAVWERDVTRNSSNVWTYGEWWKSTLTPTASEFVYHKPKILWGEDLTSGMYMTAGHTATLAEAVSAQRNGIILVFCYYKDTSSTNYNWQSFFVPKQLVPLTTSGHTFNLSFRNYEVVGTKYLYIKDASITGHADNSATGTSNGITYANDKFVLRYVIGV